MIAGVRKLSVLNSRCLFMLDDKTLYWMLDVRDISGIFRKSGVIMDEEMYAINTHTHTCIYRCVHSCKFQLNLSNVYFLKATCITLGMHMMVNIGLMGTLGNFMYIR